MCYQRYSHPDSKLQHCNSCWEEIDSVPAETRTMRIQNIFVRHSKKISCYYNILLQPRVLVPSVGVGAVIEKLGRCSGEGHGGTQSIPEEFMCYNIVKIFLPYLKCLLMWSNELELLFPLMDALAFLWSRRLQVQAITASLASYLHSCVLSRRG